MKTPFLSQQQTLKTRMVAGHSRECLDKHRSGAFPRVRPFEDQEEEIVHEAVIVCRQCRHHITDEGQRISIDGAHRHTFANPHGHVYDIACFGSAVGCYGAGPPSGEFAWFKGYSWQILICAGCMTHLGWFFISSGGRHFSGLIVDRLVSSS